MLKGNFACEEKLEADLELREYFLLNF